MPADAIGLQIHDNHKLEFWWTLFPLCSSSRSRSSASKSVLPKSSPFNAQGNTLVVEALGHQWYYTFRYPGVNGEVKTCICRSGSKITLHVSGYDVIHLFWVPDMRLKAEHGAGLINTLMFTPTRTGKYNIVCTEFWRHAPWRHAQRHAERPGVLVHRYAHAVQSVV